MSLVGEAGWGTGGGDWLGQSKGDKAKTEGHLREGTERVNSFSFPQYLFSPNTIFSRTRHCFHLQNSNFFQNLPQFYLLSLKIISSFPQFPVPTQDTPFALTFLLSKNSVFFSTIPSHTNFHSFPQFSPPLKVHITPIIQEVSNSQ